MRLLRARNAKRRALRRLLLGSWAGIALCSGRAWGFDAGKLGDQQLQVDVTNASSVIQNFDNRDTKPHQVTSVANDDWGVWYNRLNVQANSGLWNAGVRVDSAWFYTSPDPTALALELTELRGAAPGAADYFRLRLDEAGNELSNRYINWIYPAKYYLGYTTRNVEATAGDFYAQLGRGFVLSVRKLDELASDTTVRGVRVTAKTEVEGVRLRLTALSGVMNPLRIDESSGRYLGVDDSVTPGVVAVTEAGMPRAVTSDFVAESADCQSFTTCSYAPDRTAAGQVELGTDDVKLGTQGSLLARQEPLSADVSRSSEQIMTASQSIDLPDLDGHGALYLEAALQNMDRLDTGYALYGSLTLIELPLTRAGRSQALPALLPAQRQREARECTRVQPGAVQRTANRGGLLGRYTVRELQHLRQRRAHEDRFPGRQGRGRFHLGRTFVQLGGIGRQRSLRGERLPT